jgi:hypothetical protein
VLKAKLSAQLSVTNDLNYSLRGRPPEASELDFLQSWEPFWFEPLEHRYHRRFDWIVTEEILDGDVL